MTLRHEIFISLFSIIVIFLVFNPLLIFLQDLAHGNIYFTYETYNYNGGTILKLTLINEGISYLENINYNITVVDILNNIVTKTGYIDVFQKNKNIIIEIPLKVPNILPKSIFLKLEATINGLYRFNFEIKKE